MAAKRISMRKIKDILRLHHSGLSGRQIAASLRISRSVVATTLERAQSANITWPLDIDEQTLAHQLYSDAAPREPDRPLPDWPEMHRELSRKGVTLQLLWEEYRANHDDGYQYSWFCERYRQWRSKLDVVMRQDHKAGEKLFVDYAGQTMEVIDPGTGEVRTAQIFVAVLGASNYTYAEATWTQSLIDWIGSHGRAFTFFGGVPEIVVPDNLKSGVTKAHRYEPDINPTYQDLATHYGVAVIPARAAKPRDKAKAENGVLVVERWILASLRNQQFFSLCELNAAIELLLEQYNERPFQKLEGSRRSMFESIDKPALKALPSNAYVYARWKKARVHMDYHVEIEGHYYSVPYQHVRQQIDVRISEFTVECFIRGVRVASHRLSLRKGRHTTLKEHMPPKHRHCADWTQERLTAWAAKSGPCTEALALQVIASRTHPEQGYRSCLGILRLGEAYGKDRLEAASQRALSSGATSYKSMVSILKNGLDRKPLAPDNKPAIRHTNIRGANYYQPAKEVTLDRPNTEKQC